MKPKEKTKKCVFCGDPSNKCECGKCGCVKKFIKNGGNTRVSRQDVAIKHLENKPGLLKLIYGLL